MKSIVYVVVGFALSLVLTGAAWPQATSADGDASVRLFLRQFEEGVRHFVNGDATLWKRQASQREDATIMGAWGAYEKGWSEAGARYEWAAARFADSGARPTFEYLASGVSGDLAYAVAIERSVARVIGVPQPASMALRVTHIFRKEDGAWKLLHRHADPLIDKTAPAAVLEKKP